MNINSHFQLMMFLEVNASIPVGCRTPKLLSLEATKKNYVRELHVPKPWSITRQAIVGYFGTIWTTWGSLTCT